VATVVFADMVGSTGMFERLGDETAGRFLIQLTTALARTFEQHRGRVVKMLGDGLFVVFPQEEFAIAACVAIQGRLYERPLYAGGAGSPVQMQMGVESGEVVEIQGDCYGDAVNCAARLADLAGAEQILTTARVREALPLAQRARLRSLGPMHLRGKAEETLVYRVGWQHEGEVDATVMGVPLAAAPRLARLYLDAAGRQVQMQPQDQRISLGRSAGATLALNDARVSRLHAAIEWRGAHFVLSDASSFGTWVYMGRQEEPLVLRRTECFLVGEGLIALGCDRHAEEAPVVAFSVRT
jgi:class 3 adenylate cyclase